MTKSICIPAMMLLFLRAPAGAQSSYATPAPPVVQIMLNRFGISPAKITVGTGQVILAFENRLPVKDEVASLSQSSGGTGHPSAAVATLTTDAANTRTSKVLSLSPGVFVLNFANHPNYSVEITVVGQ
jgi:hypothetical protein